MSKDTKQGVPIIGEDAKAKEMSIAILNALKPTIDNFLMAVEEVQSRLAIVEGLINGALVDVLASRIERKIMGVASKELPKRSKLGSSTDVMGKEFKATKEKK